jgi:hypothetical protein
LSEQQSYALSRHSHWQTDGAKHDSDRRVAAAKDIRFFFNDRGGVLNNFMKSGIALTPDHKLMLLAQHRKFDAIVNAHFKWTIDQGIKIFGKKGIRFASDFW